MIHHRRALLVAAFAAILTLLSVWSGYTQNAKPAGTLRIAKVKGDLYMISGEGGNVAVYVTGEGVVLVDDMFDRNHADILAQVKSVTPQPVRYVINTHQHDDHAGGDMKMLPIAEVIAHRNARANLVDIKQPYYEDTPGTPIGLPRLTFNDEFSIHLGGKEITARYFGRGHTSGDVVVLFPELKAIHTGDLFLGRAAGRGGPATSRPPGANIYVDYAQGGSFLDWTKTLDGALQLDFDTVIPGHGPVSTKADVVKFRSDIETMRNRLVGFVRDGKTKDDIVRTLEADYGWRATGCPPSPPTPGCLQFQQSDSMFRELQSIAAGK
ncbi:MAG TPA: MBL fold metallo-hydrolase [Terriglobia bacterium]|nr:MBL fold metallo-hydrolase [Terriglobia bacterium]